MTEKIRKALDAMFEPGQPVELRALGVTLDAYTQNKTFGGYFDDFDKLAECAAGLVPNAKGVYVTLNPPHRRLLARCYNRVEKSPRHTSAVRTRTRTRWTSVPWSRTENRSLVH